MTYVSSKSCIQYDNYFFNTFHKEMNPCPPLSRNLYGIFDWTCINYKNNKWRRVTYIFRKVRLLCSVFYNQLYGLFQGVYKAVYRAIIQCNKPHSYELQFNSYLSKKTAVITEMKGNVTANIPLDDSLDVRLSNTWMHFVSII